MNLKNLLNRLLQRAGHPSTQSNEQMVTMIKKLLHMVENTQEFEYSCADVYQLLDQYTETVLKGENAVELMPLIKHHLDMCKDCHEEYEALLQVLQSMPS